MKKLNKKGFTLTELIVVIAVIAILAAVLIPTLTGYIEKARISADNQEVAVLNKLLLDAEINEVEFKNVNELKKYLTEEMEYDGDYTLGVKDSYLWYDTESYEFVILNKNEVEGLQSVATKTYKRSSVLESPEGLLVTGKYEVWLVGGKGEWVEAVEAIRNLGDNDTAEKALEVLNNALENLGLSSKAEQLLSNIAFVGTQGKAYEYKDGSLTIIDGETEKNVITSNTVENILNEQANFHNKYIAEALLMANENTEFNKLAEFVVGNQNADGSYNVLVNVKKVDNNSMEELKMILSFISQLLAYFYEINEADYDSTSLPITVAPNIDDNNIAAEKLADHTITLAEIFYVGITKEQLVKNMNDGFVVTEEFETQLNEILATLVASALMNKECDSSAGYSLSLITNESEISYDTSNEIIVNAKFGETTVVYNFTFVDVAE